MLGAVYERRWTISEGTQLIVPLDKTPNCFALDFPPQGLIKKLIVVQAAGPAVAFKVDLYSSLVCPEQEAGGSNSMIPASYIDNLAKIIPQQTAIAGAAVELISDGGYAYQNREGKFSKPVRKIYMKIDPTSPSTETAWEVAIAGLIMQPR